MRFDKVFPAAGLADYIKYYVIAENTQATQYAVFPSTGLVVGFQYKGTLMAGDSRLAVSGITGIADSCKVFRNSPDVGSVLVYFTETGLVHFTGKPANEVFNLSVGVDNIFEPSKVREAEERLGLARSDAERVAVMNAFFFSQLREVVVDKLIVEAVKRIYQAKGMMRMKALHEQLYISQSPFEKRFRKLVGASPKKFATIVRFNAVLDAMHTNKSLTEIFYGFDFFDQAHFIKGFKQFTGKTPEQFRKNDFLQ